MRIQDKNSRRGAAKHVFIGCGIALVVFALLFGVGGYLAWKKISKNVSFGEFQAAGKVDPPADAPADVVLPKDVAGYVREEVAVPGVPEGAENAGDAPTSGVMMAVYTKGPDTVTVTAVRTDQAEQHQNEGALQGLRGNKMEEGKGAHMRLALGGESVEMVTWANRNWTYIVNTTATQALSFAESFQPGTGEGTAGQESGEAAPATGQTP